MSNNPTVPFDQKLAMAAIAGVSGTSVVYPFDLIKTQLQTQTTVAHKGVISSIMTTARTIIASNGVSGLWRGFRVCVVGIAPEKGTKLAVNDYMREQFVARHPGKGLSISEEIASGSMAGIIQLFVTVPYEHVKIKLQMSSGRTVWQVVHSLGPRNIYRGFTATLMRDVPFCFIFFPLYSNVKALQMRLHGGTEEPFHVGLVAGMTAGVVAGCLVTPADMVKTRIQQGSGGHGFLSMVREVVRREGAGALYRGWHTRALIIGPLYGFVSMAFEVQKYWFMQRV